MKYLKKYIVGIITLMLVLSACSTQNKDTETIKDKLLALDDVVKVEEVQDNKSEWMPEKYIITFKQQLDWNDPKEGAFEQRVELGLHPDAKVTVMDTTGYLLFEDYFTRDDQPPICDILDANYVHVEHRYMGKSYPKGVTNTSTEGWQYATVENEAGDYHHIYEVLSSVLGGKWICTGVSRGGRACLDYARLYPEDDFAGYVPYVGVNPTDDNDPRMTDFLYNEVGNEFFGEEQAAHIRQTILDFQVELMKNKEALAPKLWAKMQEDKLTFVDEMTESRLYDEAVYEFLDGFWMQAGDITEVEKVLAMSDEQKDEKLDAEFELLSNYGDPSSYSFDHFIWEYYFGALLEEGTYDYNFSYIREALEAEGLEGLMDESDADKDNYLRNFVLTKEQRERYSFIPGHYEALDSWSKETDKQIIFIGADLDPWSSVYISGEGNPNFHKYILSGKTHSVKISDFDEQTQNEIIEILKSWVE